MMISGLRFEISTACLVEQEKLINALTVLSNLESKEKIRIVNQGDYVIEAEKRSWLLRYWSGDGWEPTLNLICQIFDKSLMHVRLAKDRIKACETKEIEKEMQQTIEKFKNVLPSSLEKFEGLREFYASSYGNNSKIAQAFTDKINVYFFAIIGISQSFSSTQNDLYENNDKPPLGSSNSILLQQINSTQLKKISNFSLSKGGQEVKENSPFASTKKSLVGGFSLGVSLAQLHSSQLKHVKPSSSSLKIEENELNKKLMSAQDNQHLVSPSKMDRAKYVIPNKVTNKSSIKIENEKPQLKDKISTSPLDTSDIIQGMWMHISTKFPIKEKDEEFDQTSEENNEWTIIDSAIDLEMCIIPTAIEMNGLNRVLYDQHPSPSLSSIEEKQSLVNSKAETEALHEIMRHSRFFNRVSSANKNFDDND